MEDNFEKHISDSMNDPPDIPFDEGLWKDMGKRLDKVGVEKRPLAKVWWVSLLLLLFLVPGAVAGLFYKSYIDSNNKISQLEQQIQSTSHQQIYIDSIVQKHVTVIYDTIYNKVIISKRIHEENYTPAIANRSFYTPAFQRLSLRNGRNAFSYIPNPASFSLLTNSVRDFPFSYYQNRSLWMADSGQYSPIESTDKITFLANSLYNIPSLSLLLSERFYQFEFPSAEYKESKRKKNLNYYLLKMRPASLTLSGGGGVFTSLNIPSGGGFNYTGKLQAEIGYGQQFSFIIGTEYLSHDFVVSTEIEAEEEEEDEIKGFPIMPPEDSRDVLHEIYGDFKYLQIPFGFKYTFMPQKRIHPYASIGLVAYKPLISILKYEYLGLMNEYTVNNNNVQAKAFQLSDFWASIGAQFELNNHWGAFVECSTQLGLQSNEFKYDNHQFLKLNTGFQYQF